MSHPVACFVSPHGFGHAARAGAVMLALQESDPDIEFHLYTTVPEWFFRESHLTRLVYHSIQVDVGLVQLDSFHEDLPLTVERLSCLIPPNLTTAAHLAQRLKPHGYRFSLCDISPLGIAASKLAGIPTVLVENFTWDWIYHAYTKSEPRLNEFIPRLAELFQLADLHIQASPACKVDSTLPLVPPVARPPFQSRAAMRTQLGIPQDARVVLITLGGIPTAPAPLERLTGGNDTFFLVPGGAEQFSRRGNLILFPHRSGLYHPDLVAASDAVVGKLGYSTLAETCAARLPFAFIPRPAFPESKPLSQFVLKEMAGVELTSQDYFSGHWVTRLPDLFTRKQTTAPGNGARAAADLIRASGWL